MGTLKSFFLYMDQPATGNRQRWHGSNEGNTGAAEPSATNPERKSHWASGYWIALRCVTHTTSLRCHPHVPTFEPCPTWGMVQMRVTPGPQNQAQRTQSVSPIGLVVNGLHCAASHTHDFSQVSPSRANF